MVLIYIIQMENKQFNRKQLNADWLSSKQFPFKVDLKLLQNRERKAGIQLLKLREKECIMEKRKNKENSIQKMLESRYEERKIAKELFDTFRKENFFQRKSEQTSYLPWCPNNESVRKNNGIKKSKTINKTQNTPDMEAKLGKVGSLSVLKQEKEENKQKMKQKRKKEGRKKLLRKELNPIEIYVDLGVFGLQSEKMNNESILNDIKKFIKENKSSQTAPENDKLLLQYLEGFLSFETFYFS